jgi:hypothetical protein
MVRAARPDDHADEETLMQRFRGVAAGAVIGVPLGAYVHLQLHGILAVAILAGACVGLPIAFVVGTRSDARDAAADAAWRAAAPDLPPVSDRTALERSQATMPAPSASRRAGSRPADHAAVPSGAGGPEEDDLR